MLEKRLKHVGEHFVRAVANEHLLRRKAMKPPEGLSELCGVRVRVETQRVTIDSGQDLQHLRRRWIGIFVGVQLDQLLAPRLLPRHVGRQLADQVTPVAAHVSPVGHGPENDKPGSAGFMIGVP